MFLQILMAVSFLVAGYQDVRRGWSPTSSGYPPSSGVALALYFFPSQDVVLLVEDSG